MKVKNVHECRDHIDLWCDLPMMIRVSINIHCIDVFKLKGKGCII